MEISNIPSKKANNSQNNQNLANLVSYVTVVNERLKFENETQLDTLGAALDMCIVSFYA